MTNIVPVIKGHYARQALGVIFLEIALADFVARGNVIDFEAPPGTEFVGGEMVIVTAFNTTGTDTLSFGDGTSAARYLAATSLKAAANTRTAATPTGFKYVDAATPFLRLTRTPADAAATVGTVRIRADFATLGKSEWTVG